MKLDVLAPLTKVSIKELKCDGIVEWIKVDYGNTVMYQVSYWQKGDQKFAMLHTFEVEEINPIERGRVF